MQVVATQADIFWTQITTLEGQPFQFRFRYNTREAAYYLQISLPDGSVDLAAVKLVCGFPLLASYNDARLPPGELICASYGPDDSPVRIGDFGVRVDLVYYLASEVEAQGLEAWRNPNGNA